MSYYCMSYGRNKGSRWSLPPTTNQTVKFRPFSIGDKSGWDLEKVWFAYVFPDKLKSACWLVCKPESLAAVNHDGLELRRHDN